MMITVGTGTGVERLRALYDRHALSLFRLGVALTGSTPLAEDLMHEAFVRFARAGGSVANGTELAYLRRTVVNLSHDHHRRLMLTPRLGTGGASHAPSAEAVAVATDRSHRIRLAIAALPGRQRDCIVLHYFAGLSDVAISEELGISVGSVKTHLHRARASLAGRLEDLR